MTLKLQIPRGWVVSSAALNIFFTYGMVEFLNIVLFYLSRVDCHEPRVDSVLD